MKKTDVAMLILIASVSVLVSYGIVSSIPGLKLSGKPVQVKTTEKFTSDVAEPSKLVFNKDAINPTVGVTIGESAQANPTDTGQ